MRHKTDEARPFKCNQCPATFKILNHLRSHQKIVHSQAEKQFSCDNCNKGFVFKYLLTSHIRYAHSDIRRFACNYCGLKYKINSHMREHCRRAHGTNFAYPCKMQQCTIKVRTLNELKNHLQDEHGVSMNPQKYHGN
jgi:KRAB domain-containing zinc finger protein